MLLKLFTLLLISSCAFAQQTINVEKNDISPVRDGLFYTVAGTPFSPYKYVRVVSGSPYFKDSWGTGYVLIAGGGQAKSDKVKLDPLSGDVLYKDSADNELTATTPIASITLTDPEDGKSYVFINSDYLNLSGKYETGWYQLLVSGTATVYKKIKKTISESKPFNSATTEQTINTNNYYFVVVNGAINVVKKLKDVSSILADKKQLVDQLITSKKLTGKNDSDFLEVIAYYNSLVESEK
jgi:hypothetical protein